MSSMFAFLALRRRVPGRPVLTAALLLVALAFVGRTALAEEPRSLNGVALVIGQSEYSQIPALPNPANDARDMVKLLTDLGFDARSVTNRDAARLRRDLERFAEDAEGADVALIYYSGHGIEAGGENWLVPVDANAASLDDAAEKLVPLSTVLDSLKATVPVTIVLLDACRTNPFPPGSMVKTAPDAAPAPVGASGLALVRGVKLIAQSKPADDNLGMVIGFAAEPGQPALDGNAGSNSPYAAALLRHLAALKGVEFGQVMRMVTEEVYLATGTKQRPWTNESLRRLLYFGVAPEEPAGPDGRITGERRQLLLTMADLPSAERIQVEQVAAREGVKLDALYGVLRAMGTEIIPKDPAQFDKLLQEQAGRLREMTAQRAALRTDDPELASLSAAADRAIGEGAIVTAREFLDQAVARIEKNAGTLDNLEQQLKEKRLADAAIYVKRADAASLAFAFSAAAADYGKAYELVVKWDEKLAWNYKNLEAQALYGQGDARHDTAAYKASLVAYQTVLDMVPNGDRGHDWATTSNNMAVVLHSLGEMESGVDNLQRALVIFEQTSATFASLSDDVNWAASQNNIGNIYVTLGERTGDPAMLRKALAAYSQAIAKRPREADPASWMETQGNIGIAEYRLAEPAGDVAGFRRAEAAYRAALEVATRDSDPISWASITNNLGNTLTSLGEAANDPALHRQAIEAFEAAMTVRNRETWPADWALSQVNLGTALVNLAVHETGVDSLGRAKAAFDSALEVFDRAAAPLDWAAAKNNLASTLQTIGQRNRDLAVLEQSHAAFEAAREVYVRSDFPMDWAMTQMNDGNTLHLMAALSGDAAFERQAVVAYRNGLEEHRRDRAPLLWAQNMSNLALALQSLATVEDFEKNLREAADANRAALEVVTPDMSPIDWANAKSRLGICLLNLSTGTGKPDTLAEARQVFEESLRIFTREAAPMQWAIGQNNIGDVHWNLAAFGGGKPEAGKAIGYFNAAREIFVAMGQQPMADLIDKKITLVNEAFK